MISLILPHIYLNKFYIGDELKNSIRNYEKIEVSGFGIAKIIKALQGEVHVFTFLGGNNGKEVRKEFLRNKIKSEIVFTKNQTEMKVNICDGANKYQLNSMPKVITEKEYIQFYQLITENKHSARVVMLDQRYFKDDEHDFYLDVLKTFSCSNNKLILNIDKSKDWKEIDVKLAVPYAVIHTIDENNVLWTESQRKIIDHFQDAFSKGIHYVIIHVYKKGILFCTKNKKCFIDDSSGYCSNESLESFDSFLGGLAVGIERKYEHENIFKYAYSSAYSTINNGGVTVNIQNSVLRNKKRNKLVILQESK